MTRRKTTEEFIVEAQAIHGLDKFSYALVGYVGLQKKVEIVCLKCGDHFWQTPANHLKKKGCPKCAGNKRRTTEEFIAESKRVHGEDRYGYELARYAGKEKKITLICRECDRIFDAYAGNHLKGYGGCPACSDRSRLTTEEWIARAISVHGQGAYGYDLVDLDKAAGKVDIVCNGCGERFSQKAAHHLSGHGCRSCSGKEAMRGYTITSEKFVSDAEAVHGQGTFDYSLLIKNYKKGDESSEIVCNACGYHFWQTYHQHVVRKAGCGLCAGKVALTQEVFLERARKRHGVDRYNYDLVSYSTGKEYIEIGCNSCGNVFRQTASAHLSGQGCPSCADYGFQPQKPAILYYVRFTLPDLTPLYKIGITNRTVQERFSNEPLPYVILQQTPFLFGFLARDREQEILSQYDADRYDGDALVSGNTEAFVRDILDLDKPTILSA